jgi:hypothetical protein
VDRHAGRRCAGWCPSLGTPTVDEPAEVPGTHAQQPLPHVREYPGLGKFDERLDWLRTQAETATTNGRSAAYLIRPATAGR